ncbi:MAG: STAS domain-containing protein [Stackebrandtia sp.]
MELTISTRTDGPFTVVQVGGEIDMFTATELREALHDRLAENVTNLAIDVNGVEFCDSTGLGVIIGVLRRLRESGGRLVIMCARPQMLKIFQLTGLDTVLDIRDELPADG